MIYNFQYWMLSKRLDVIINYMFNGNIRHVYRILKETWIDLKNVTKGDLTDMSIGFRKYMCKEISAIFNDPFDSDFKLIKRLRSLKEQVEKCINLKGKKKELESLKIKMELWNIDNKYCVDMISNLKDLCLMDTACNVINIDIVSGGIESLKSQINKMIVTTMITAHRLSKHDDIGDLACLPLNVQLIISKKLYMF